MLASYGIIPVKTIRQEAKKAIRDITSWFENNPKRRVCKTEMWYGKMHSIKRKTITEQVDEAAAEAIKGTENG